MSQPTVFPGPFHVLVFDLNRYSGTPTWYDLKHADTAVTSPTGPFKSVGEALEAAIEFLETTDAANVGTVCKIMDDDESLPMFGLVQYVYPRNDHDEEDDA